MAADKKRAQAGEWRIPEADLHFLEIAGGWPGSLLAQHRFRHKVAKGSYQFTFWLIVVIYQTVAFDYICDWRFSASSKLWILEKYHEVQGATQQHQTPRPNS